MIRLLDRKKIDSAKWDHCILNAPNGSVYNLSWYLDHVSVGWCALVEDDYKTVMPIPFRQKLGIQIVYQPFFTRQSGIFSEELSEEKVQEFLNKIPPEFKKIQLCLDHIHNQNKNFSFNFIDWIYQELSLENSIEIIRKNYSENARRMLKKAKSNDLRFTFSDNANELIRFFRENKGDELIDVREEHYYRLLFLMKAGIQKGCGKVAEVWMDNELVAIGYFWWFREKVIYLKGTANEKGRKSGAMYMLFDEIISQSIPSKKALDFGGSRIPNIAGFYYRFGGKDKVYTCLIRDTSPAWFRIGNKIRKSFRKNQ